MKNWFVRLKLSRQLALVSGLFLLIPMLLLWYTILRGQQNSVIQSRAREARSRCDQAQTQVQRVAELCNMSTQVYLNTPALTGHLSRLKQGEVPEAGELLDFYRTTIASLEKITLSNPDLYQIRVYAEAEEISEMMPILYSRRRMETLPWAGKDPASGSWQMDFDDRLFAGDPVTPHIMSLVTYIIDPSYGRLGTLEVAVRMDEMLPELFDGSAGEWTALVDWDGALLAGEAPVDGEELAELTRIEDGAQYALSGERVLVTRIPLKELECYYLQVTSLSGIYRTVRLQFVYLLAVFLTAFAVLAWAVSALTRRILRGFYGAFDGLWAFAGGDIDARVEVAGRGEVADFARAAGGLLDRIRQLMRDNLERETQAQRSEMRALQNQINAHFIYNVLEAIKMMAEIDEEYEIADAVTTLGKLLRYSMKLEGGNVRLEQELEYVKNYVTLMNLRYDYEIGLELDIPQELMEQAVPKISLQPIVENAVVHGAAAMAADSVITLSGETDRDNGRFTIRIADQGVGMEAGALERLHRQIAGEEQAQSSSGNGIGLKNVHDRIRMAFGEEYGLRISSQPEQGTTVLVILPYQEKGETG